MTNCFTLSFMRKNFLQKIYNYSAIDMVKVISGRFARRSFAQIKSIRPKRICRSLKEKQKGKRKQHGKTVTVHVEFKGN